ncbi:YdcF family protein [Corynebacterium guangdongense]|uniref:DUF218 domain-containing protein n=1 Tax=Corynebacterium guangdongense TaxID=1783348 RepID=A0ABU2A0K2_9CORY|nr:YdcF family protein [Corynebacterium guangdongense]MDR7330709.1 hypothetical protein [Corynebacterium guangdongense]
MRTLIATLITATLLPATAGPAGASSVSPSPGSVSQEVVVSVPGYGPYRLSPDLTSAVGVATGEDLLSAAALSADYEGDAVARDAARSALTPEGRAGVDAALAAIHHPIAPPETVPGSAPIVVLGNGLAPDGSVRPNLANRLEAARQLAVQRPAAPVVASGGPTADGYVESHAMKRWLIDAGVAPERILTEEQSYSTVSNARLTRALLPEAREVLVVSSQDHVHRAVVDVTLAFGPGARVAGVGAQNDPPAAMPDLSGVYRDAVAWYLG